MSQSVGMNLLARVLTDVRVADFYQLKREFFYKDEVTVYDWVAAHLERHGVLPSLSLTKKRTPLRGVDSEDPYGVWYSEYLNRALYNRFNDVLPTITKLLSERKSTDALDRITEFFEGANTIRTDGQQDLANAVQVGQEVLTEFLRLRSLNGMSGIPTGWRYLDNVSHGYQRGDLIVFAARPGVGKSTIAIKTMLEAHRAGVIPLFISMEMKRVQIGARFVAMAGGMNMKTLKAGQLTSFGEMRIEEVIEQYRGLHPLYIIEGQFRKTINEIHALVQSLRPGILIVDGAYLLKLPQQNMMRMPLWERIGEIAERLKKIAMNENIPVVCTFQINREGGRKDRSGRDAGVEHLQLSDAIGQLASLIIAVFSDEDSDATDSDLQRRMKILKGREGESGQWFINWVYSRMNFDQVEDNLDSVGETVQ